MQVSNNSNTLSFPTYWPQQTGAIPFKRPVAAPSSTAGGTTTSAKAHNTTASQKAERPGFEYATTDDMLLRRVAQHDLSAFEQLYDHYAPLLYALILRIVRERSLADELLQETFMHIWAKANEFRGEMQAAAWLFNLARSKSLDALRWVPRDPMQQAAHLDLIAQEARNEMETTYHQDRGDQQSGFESEGGSTQHKLSGMSDVRIQQALHIIQPEQRVCLELAFFGGLTQQQIAEHLHLPLSVVKSFIRKGLALLEQTLYRNELTSEQQRDVILA